MIQTNVVFTQDEELNVGTRAKALYAAMAIGLRAWKGSSVPPGSVAAKLEARLCLVSMANTIVGISEFPDVVMPCA